jgi:hypothetical protein
MISPGSYRPDDYIIRQIVQFAEGIARILGLLRDDKAHSALGAVDREIETLLLVGHRAEAVFTLANDELNALLEVGAVNQVDYIHRCFYLAALVESRGDALAAQRRHAEAIDAWIRSLDITIGLHEALLEEGGDFDVPEFAPPLSRLREKLVGVALPDYIERRLAAVRNGPFRE